MSVYCPICRQEAFDGLDSDFCYCQNCDELFDPNEPPSCPECGEEMPEDVSADDQCPHCGWATWAE